MPSPWGFCRPGSDWGIFCTTLTWGIFCRCASEPVLSVSDMTQNTGSFVIFDSLKLVALVDDSDGRDTTSVEMYDGLTLIGMATEGPEGVWSFTYNVTTSGSHSYTAKRIFSTGYQLSNVVTITVLNYIEPDDVTSATILAWYRSPESNRLFTTLFGLGTAVRTITIASSTSLDGRTEGVYVDIIATGLPGVGTFKTSINNGISFLETNPVTIPAGAGTYTLPGTDLTITFQQAVSYNADNVYRGTVSAWLDKVGAFPNSTNNLINDASSGGGGTRPRILAASNAAAGAPAIRFDAGLAIAGFLWNTAGSIATAFSGTDKHFSFWMLAEIMQADIPLVVGTRKDLYSVTNLTDTDQPRITLGVSYTASTNATVDMRANRVSDTGVNKVHSSGAVPFADLYLIEDSFDGTFRSVTMNAADFIGGDSGIIANQSGQTITTTRWVLGMLQDQAGKQNQSIFDAYELLIFDGPLSTLESWQLRAYFLA